jgi:glycosyltransferase involved in cell wall biosynthesis
LTLQKIGKLSVYHPLIIALKYAEKYALQNSDLVTAVPQNSKKYLVSRGMAPSRFLHIGNSFNLDLFSKSLPLEKMIQTNLIELKNQGSILVGYCGSLGLANAMHVPINAISKTKDDRINLIIVGNGAKEDELRRLVKDLDVQERVHFFDFLPHNQVPSFLSYMDASYVGSLKSKLYKYGASPTKINDYMVAEKPIIYAVGDPNNSIEKSGCGICCEAEDTEQISVAMDKIVNMSNSELQVMGERGRVWLLKNQTIQIQIQKILNKL